jgi:hypothetical protein
MGNWFSDLFKSKDVKQEVQMPSWQSSAASALSSWAQKYLSQYVPGQAYSGKLTAPMAEGEKAGQEWLAKYLNQPQYGEAFGAAKKELLDTMGGERYDPTKSEFYRPLREGVQYEVQDAIDAARRGQGARGTYFQDTSIRDENKIRERGSNFLAQTLGSLSEKERERRLGAVPQLMDLEQYEQGVPLERAKAGSTIGSLPRLIEQSDLEAKYKDFVRQQEELSAVPGATQGVMNTRVPYTTPMETSSPFERIMKIVGPLAGTVAGTMFGGPAGGALGGSLGSMGSDWLSKLFSSGSKGLTAGGFLDPVQIPLGLNY